MKIYFSRRHRDAIGGGQLKVSFSQPCRTSILRLLERHSDWGGWDDQENLTFTSVEDTLKTFYGTQTLKAFDENNKRVPASVDKVIVHGYPSEVLDIIEAWFDQNPKMLAATQNRPVRDT